MNEILASLIIAFLLMAVWTSCHNRELDPAPARLHLTNGAPSKTFVRKPHRRYPRILVPDSVTNKQEVMDRHSVEDK